MRFNFGKTFLLGLGFFGVSVIWMVYNTFVPPFLANRFGLEPALIGFFMTLDNIAAILIQPGVGAWSDRLRTPIGRRMPFILIGAPVGALAFGLIPLAGVLPLFVACTSTLLLSMAFWRTPVVALMPDITPSQYRSQANGIINFMGGLGAIAATLGGSMLYRLNEAYPFWLGSALVLLSTLLLFVFIREPRQPMEAAAEEKPRLWQSFQAILRDSDKSALRILLAIFAWFVAYNAIEAFFTLYAQNHLGLPVADGAALLGLLSLLFVLSALPSGYIGGWIGRRVTIMIGIVLLAACMLAMFVIPADTLTIRMFSLPRPIGVVPVVGIILMVAGASWGLINVNSLPMVVDMTDQSRIGTFTGLYYLFSAFAAIIGPNLNGLIIQLAGSDYSVAMLIGPVFMTIALVLMLGVRRGEAQSAGDQVQASSLPETA